MRAEGDTITSYWHVRQWAPDGRDRTQDDLDWTCGTGHARRMLAHIAKHGRYASDLLENILMEMMHRSVGHWDEHIRAAFLDSLDDAVVKALAGAGPGDGAPIATSPNGPPAPSIEALLVQYKVTFLTMSVEEPDALTDRNHALWDTLNESRPKTLADCAALLDFGRHIMVRMEGDSAGEITELWLDDLHRTFGRVQACVARNA